MHQPGVVYNKSFLLWDQTNWTHFLILLVCETATNQLFSPNEVAPFFPTFRYPVSLAPYLNNASFYNDDLYYYTLKAPSTIFLLYYTCL